MGAGWLATNGNLQYSVLGKTFLLPLACGPVISIGLAVIVYPVFRYLRKACGVTDQSCICVGQTYEEVVINTDGSIMMSRTGTIIEAGIDTRVFCVV